MTADMTVAVTGGAPTTSLSNSTLALSPILFEFPYTVAAAATTPSLPLFQFPYITAATTVFPLLFQFPYTMAVAATTTHPLLLIPTHGGGSSSITILFNSMHGGR